MTNQQIDLTADMLDVRDLIARVEELQDEIVTFSEDEDDERRARAWGEANPEDAQELAALTTILEELKGYGGDEQWRGDWYPVLLIRDSYFKEYARQLAEEIGEYDPQAQWPLNCVDWERAARELQIDYSTVEINGVTYWYR